MSGWLVIRIPTCSPGCTPSATSEEASAHARSASSPYVTRASGKSSASCPGSRRALRSNRCPSGITSWASSMLSIGAVAMGVSLSSEPVLLELGRPALLERGDALREVLADLQQRDRLRDLLLCLPRALAEDALADRGRQRRP